MNIFFLQNCQFDHKFRSPTDIPCLKDYPQNRTKYKVKGGDFTNPNYQDSWEKCKLQLSNFLLNGEKLRRTLRATFRNPKISLRIAKKL